ncbi:MAG: ribonuclease P protein subunit [Thermoplasmata archaeon]|nr:MAG: ribonuclease P protein subunit [Thermoplasmata archaeon]
MSITKHNIHKHEFIGLYAQIIDSSDKGCIGLSGTIVDETKNTFKLKTADTEKTIQKYGTVLSMKIGCDEVAVDASKLRFRPEDRIKKIKKRAV